ncbi:MAG: outer membrane protein transport protein [Pseudomonadota bacterium]
MKNIATLAAALGLAAGAVQAGSIQRDNDRSQILFEPGKNYLEFSVVNFTGEISGTGTGAVIPFLAGSRSGNIFQNYQSYGLAYKYQYNEQLTFAVVANNPVGADVAYPISPYIFSGSTAEITSLAVTGYVKYRFNENISAYAGVRAQRLDGSVDLISSLAGSYALNVSPDYSFGYVLGAAYEIPDIAMRVALTYESKIEHDFRDNNGTPFEVEIPQAVTLHARTGISPTMLVFGSIRWQEWTQFEVAPADFSTPSALNPGGLPIAFGTDDFWTYEIGLGRKFSENWSGAVTVGYENDGGVPVGNLEGKDGYVSYGISAKYSTEAYDISLGLKYFDLGSATTTTIASDFSGNHALGVGAKIGWRF